MHNNIHFENISFLQFSNNNLEKICNNCVKITHLEDCFYYKDLNNPKNIQFPGCVPRYASPELVDRLFANYKIIGPSSDIWSFGILAYELVLSEQEK